MTRVASVASQPAEFTLTRVFDAPRDLVYQVWTDQRYVVLWWGVEGAENPVCELDVRPGGHWRIDMRTAGGVVYPNGGEFVEVIENERLVYTDRSDPGSPAWKGAPPPGDRLNIVTFEDEGEGTRVTLRVQFSSVADRTFFVGAGMKQGIGQSLDRLGRVLATAVAYVTSPDGSRIAYQRFGTGPAVILVGGALNDRRAKASGVPLAQRLAARFTAFAYDRRGRGDSTEVHPSSVAHEIDDLRMLIEAAGGSAALYGMSSGGALVLAAAAAGLPVTKIALFEPPFSTDAIAEERAKGYAKRLRELVAAKDNGGALELFLTFIGMPPQMISGMRNSPAWESLSALGLKLVQDAEVMDNDEGAPVPNARIESLEIPILVMVGEKSPPALRQAGERVAAAARRGSCTVLPDQTHDVALDALVPVLTNFLAEER